MNHVPVLLHEVIDSLSLRPGAFIIDGTVNGGGHAREILKRIEPDGTLLCCDWDPHLLAEAEKTIHSSAARVLFAHTNYADLSNVLKARTNELGARSELDTRARSELDRRADGVVLDLGFSSAQLEDSGRGFSFQKDEPLLMTYDDESEPVRDILTRLPEGELGTILIRLSNERYARPIAKAIKKREHEKVIQTTHELANVVRAAVPRGYERGRIDPATRTFQALRIYANQELENLQRFLDTLPEILRPGGRVAVISFHSLEDRIVKNALRDSAKKGVLEVLTKKPITATDEETRHNPRSRSAKLRVAQMK